MPLVGGGKICSSVGQPSKSIVMGIFDSIEAAIWLHVQIPMSPMGCRAAVRSVATFLPMKDGHVTCPLWVWNASSSGQCLNLS